MYTLIYANSCLGSLCKTTYSSQSLRKTNELRCEMNDAFQHSPQLSLSFSLQHTLQHMHHTLQHTVQHTLHHIFNTARHPNTPTSTVREERKEKRGKAGEREEEEEEKEFPEGPRGVEGFTTHARPAQARGGKSKHSFLRK
jgi:hypothetical protein